MMTLADLFDGNVEIAVTESVAIAQQLICDRDIPLRAGAPYGPPTPETVAVAADGRVHCLHTAATPSVMEVALLLQTLIRRSGGHVPGGLRYAVGRALLEVEAPPFDSADEFSSAISRFEAGDRREQVARLYGRASSALLSHCDGSGEPDAASGIERRAHQPSAAELRRQLREADLKLYEAQRLAKPDHRGASTRRLRRAPIAACMVAGVALVAAGEYAHVGRRAPTPASSQPQPPATTSLAAEQTGPIVSTQPVRSVTTPGATSPPMKTAATVSRTRASHARVNGVRSDTRPGRNVAAPSEPIRSNSATRQNVALRRAPKREHSDPDRGVLARIRFEWNNPFH